MFAVMHFAIIYSSHQVLHCTFSYTSLLSTAKAIPRRFTSPPTAVVLKSCTRKWILMWMRTSHINSDVCALEIDEDEWKMFLKWSNKRVTVLPMTLHLSLCPCRPPTGLISRWSLNNYSLHVSSAQLISPLSTVMHPLLLRKVDSTILIRLRFRCT